LPKLTASHSSVLDSLEDQIAVIDREGTIIYVNRAWITFGIENGLAAGFPWLGSNYLKVCNGSNFNSDSLAGEAAQGLRDVLSGKSASLYFEYPCHSPTEKRWFIMRATPLHGGTGKLFVISHHNITQRKLAQEKAEHLSLHDPLTGLANRRYFDQFLGKEWRRNARDRSPLSFVMFDLDHFKDYNDELGHLAGDDCLVKAGQILNAHSGRPGDLAVRYGGEEFGLLLGNTSLEEAARIAESVRKAIYDLGMSYRGTRRITVSAGVASTIPDREQSEMDLVREADKALYRAKQNGRNQISVCTAVITE